MEYGNVGASATQLSRFDFVQNVATSLRQTSFGPLQCCHHAAAVGLLLKILDCHCRELLQTFVHLKFDIAQIIKTSHFYSTLPAC